MKKICVVTGTRAEYGLLKPLINRINIAEDMELQLVVTGMHLSPEFGLTYQEIEKDGFIITEKNEMLLSSDTPNGITKSIGLGTIGFADIFTRIQPDMVVILGDRYEAFTAATAAMIHRIPIAHIHGGELTEGAIDDSIRHSITKMSVLHFTSTEEYRRRVIQLGEQPSRVYCVGALGVENIKKQKLLTRSELEQNINFTLDKPFVVVTYHPVTLEGKTSEYQFRQLLKALNILKHYKIIFTKANSDTEGRIINELIDEYAQTRQKNVAVFTSLGMIKYLSALKYCEMVVGNSSSGLLEAPSFGIPTVNIGNRQKGRVRAKTVIDCGNTEEDIVLAINKAIEFKKNGICKEVINPYEKDNTSSKIYEIIKEKVMKSEKLDKRFYDINEDKI